MILTGLGRRVAGLFGKARRERDLDAEVRSHLEMLAEEHVRRGLAPDEARRAALRDFGGIEKTKEAYRDQRGIPLVEHLLQDIRYAARALRKSPGFTAAAVLTLALGIGANAAMFSLVNAVILRSLPVEKPEDLAVLSVRTKEFQFRAFSYPFFKDLRERTTVFAGLFARWGVKLSLTSEGATERVEGELVTGDYFRVLGLRPLVGRLLTADDDRTPGAHTVCVLGYSLWRNRFGGDPAIVGRTIRLNGKPFTVIGVTPASFTSTEPGLDVDIRVPMMMQRDLDPLGFDRLGPRRSAWIAVIGRLKPGMTREHAAAALEVTVNQIARQHRMDTGRVLLEPGNQGWAMLRTRYERPLLILMGIVGGVLLVACANLANLLLARGAVRRREIAVRIALGASRARVMRQLLTEALLLTACGALLGLVAGSWVSRAVLALARAPWETEVALDTAPDWRVFAFTAAVALVVAVVFGAAPSMEATRVDLSSAMKDAAGRRFGGRGRKCLVGGQIAVSLVLLAGAGLFIGTLRNLQSLDPGFRPEHVALLSVNPRMNGYSETAAAGFYARLLDRVRGEPGIRSAALVRVSPLSGGSTLRDFTPEGYTYKPSDWRNYEAYTNAVSPGYFRTMQIPVIMGREFTERDRTGTPPAVIVNETFARRYWPAGSPIGKHIIWGSAEHPKWGIEVVGVVRDSFYSSLREQRGRVVIYTPVAQEQDIDELTVVARADGDPRAAIAAVAVDVRDLDRSLPVYNAATMTTQLDRSLATERLLATLAGSFGALALFLAAVGMYGVVAYSVGSRTREIGVRMALGASHRGILAMILRESAAATVGGIAAGVPLALAATRLIASLLYGLEPRDPFVFASVTLLLAAVALAAALLPARRATRIEPTTALRDE